MGEKKRRLAAGFNASTRTQKIVSLLEDARQLQSAGRLREAETNYRQVLESDPSHAGAWHGLGMLARMGGAPQAAIGLLGKAVEVAPQMPEYRMDYAAALHEAGRIDAAIAQWQAICAARPRDARCWESLGIVLQVAGNIADAGAAYRRALALQPSAGRRIKLATLISPIIASRADIEAQRGNMQTILEDICAENEPGFQDPMQAGLWSNFYLAYHGQCNRDLHTGAATAYLKLCPSLGYVAAHCVRPRQPGNKIRVGLISQFFRNHSIGRTSRGLFAHFSRDEFEVTAIFIAPVADDDFSRFIRAHAEHSLVVPQELAAARRMIEAQQLDILFYQDIGMEPFSYFLAFSRLAPVQCVSFGHPDTTGIPAIDYFVSNDLYETPASQHHYSERLFLLHNLASLACYTRPELPAQPKSRADFGFSSQDHLYICPQNLFKFHPDMDDLIAGILRRDERGKLLMVAGRVEEWTALLKRRWAAFMPDVLNRIIFLPRMNGQDYVNLIAIGDVMLDTVHFNGMNTSLEALAVGTPVVTWPGVFQRGRHTQAMYRKMGVTDCIADCAESYVDLAVRLGTNAQYRSAVRERILERNGALFEDVEVVREFERFFREACETRMPLR